MAVQVKCQKNHLLAIPRQDCPKYLIYYKIPVGLLIFKNKNDFLAHLWCPSPRNTKCKIR